MRLSPRGLLDIHRELDAELAVKAEHTRRVREAQNENASVRDGDQCRIHLTTDELARAAGGAPAAKAGELVEIGGTSALGEDGRVLYPGDPYRQTQAALGQVGTRLRAMGASLDQVIRTRVYLKKAWQATEVARAHRDAFGSAHPVTTFVGAGAMIDPDALVVIEATAHLR